MSFNITILWREYFLTSNVWYSSVVSASQCRLFVSFRFRNNKQTKLPTLIRVSAVNRLPTNGPPAASGEKKVPFQLIPGLVIWCSRYYNNTSRQTYILFSFSSMLCSSQVKTQAHASVFSVWKKLKPNCTIYGLQHEKEMELWMVARDTDTGLFCGCFSCYHSFADTFLVHLGLLLIFAVIYFPIY